MTDKQAWLLQVAQSIKENGFRVFVAASQTHGFYTDTDGTRVCSFETPCFSINFSGNYKPSREAGNGWRIADVGMKPNADMLKRMLYAGAPEWTRNPNPKYTTLEQHLNTYQSSSKYTEL